MHPVEQELREAAARLAVKSAAARKVRFAKEAAGEAPGAPGMMGGLLDAAKSHWGAAKGLWNKHTADPSVRAGLWSALAGAGAGGALGLGAHLTSEQPNKRPFANMLTGALLGAGLGGAGGWGLHRLANASPSALPYTPNDVTGWKKNLSVGELTQKWSGMTPDEQKSYGDLAGFIEFAHGKKSDPAAPGVGSAGREFAFNTLPTALQGDGSWGWLPHAEGVLFAGDMAGRARAGAGLSGKVPGLDWAARKTSLSSMNPLTWPGAVYQRALGPSRHVLRAALKDEKLPSGLHNVSQLRGALRFGAPRVQDRALGAVEAAATALAKDRPAGFAGLGRRGMPTGGAALVPYLLPLVLSQYLQYGDESAARRDASSASLDAATKARAGGAP